MEQALETIINLAFDKLEKENKIKYTKAWTRDRFISAVLEKRTVDTRKFYMHFKIIVYKEDGSLLQAGAQDNRLCRYVGYKLIGKNPIKIEDIEKPIQRNRGIDYDNICNFTQSIIPIDRIYDTTDEQLLNLLIKFKEFLGKYSAINSNARTLQKYYEKEKSCKNCGYDKHVEVAHIKAIADFPDNSLISEINAKDNLVYLCPNCHWEFDNNLLSL